MPDLATVRQRNIILLREEFERNVSPSVGNLRGMDKAFCERVGIHPSLLSRIRAGSYHAGEKLARQFEVAMRKPAGWLDQAQEAPSVTPAGYLPASEEERFAVSVFLAAYREHPRALRQRLLEQVSRGFMAGTVDEIPAVEGKSKKSSRSLLDKKLNDRLT